MPPSGAILQGDQLQARLQRHSQQPETLDMHTWRGEWGALISQCISAPVTPCALCLAVSSNSMPPKLASVVEYNKGMLRLRPKPCARQCSAASITEMNRVRDVAATAVENSDLVATVKRRFDVCFPTNTEPPMIKRFMVFCLFQLVLEGVCPIIGPFNFLRHPCNCRTSVKPLPLVQALMLVLTLGSTAAMNAQAPEAARPARPASPWVTPPLIPRAALFGNPVKAGAQLSPNGKWLSWMAPVNGVMNVWVAPADKPERSQGHHRLDRPADSGPLLVGQQ